MNLREYMEQDAVGLAAAVRAGGATPSELLALARERADAVNPRLNAIIRQLHEIADARAAAALTGPLAGVPFLVKDLAQEYAGTPTSYGSQALIGNIAAEHAEIVRRWLDAGLVIFGKTNTPEFGAKGVTEPDIFGPARNPWDPTRTPGGSSGGSAAAVASGIVPAAGANDGGGSIRIPAACCGLVGLKPGRGVTPFGPLFGEPLHGMAVQGVVSRTVRDSAVLLDAVTGPETTGTYLASTPAPSAQAIAAPPQRLQIGFTADSAINPSPHPDAVAAVEEAAKLLAELGHEVEAVAPPYDDGTLARDFLTIWFAQVAFEVSKTKRLTGARNEDFESDTLTMAELGRAGGVVSFMEALERRNDHVRALSAFHERYDYYLTPTLAEPPPLVSRFETPQAMQVGARALAALRGGAVLQRLPLLDQMVEQNLGWVPYTQLANVTGRPAISVPLHWTQSGLPLGVQFVGRLGSETALLQLAAQLEQARPWAERRPPSD